MKIFGKVLAGGVLAAIMAVQFTAASASVKLVSTGTVHDAFFGVAFDGKQGFAVGAGGVISETADGGATWKLVPQKATELSLLAVDRHGDQAIAVGQLGTALVRESSGAWTKADTGSQNRLLSISLNSRGVAVASGEFGTLIKSTDGGRTWSSVAPDWPSMTPGGSEPHIYTVQIGEGESCIAAGEFGLILRSNDGCSTWQAVHPATEGAPSVFSVRLGVTDTGAPLGFAVGQTGLILRSVDGGRAWESVQSGTESNLLGVDLLAGNGVLITGIRSMLSSKDSGLTFSNVEGEDIATTWYQMPRTVERGSTAIAVGHSGRILQVAQ